MPETISRPISLSLVLGALLLGACSGVTVEEPEPFITDQEDRIRQQAGTIHGNDKGFVLYSTRDDAESGGSGGGLFGGSDDQPAAVGPLAANPYLWQASLESLDFMPLAQADATSGVIISDWYAPPETPSERFKVNVFIRDQALRADALKVTVFRQTREDIGWVDAEVDTSTATGLEDNILKRARELRLVNGASG